MQPDDPVVVREIVHLVARVFNPCQAARHGLKTRATKNAQPLVGQSGDRVNGLNFLSLRAFVPLCLRALVCITFASSISAQTTQPNEPLILRSALVPGTVDYGPVAEGQRRIVEAFRQHHPDILPVTTAGLLVNSSSGSDILPLMQIAGDIAPDVMYVNFRQ